MSVNSLSDKAPVMTPEQCRAARAVLNMTLRELAGAAKLMPNTVSAFEQRKRWSLATAHLLQLTLERYGFDFNNPKSIIWENYDADKM